MDLYRKVRLARVGGMSQRECALHFGIARETVRKIDNHSVPPGYQRRKPVAQPKLGPFIEIIDTWLDADKVVHRKQRHTAKRVFDRLRAEHGFDGGYTIVKDYIRKREQRSREMFVPLANAPGVNGGAKLDHGSGGIVLLGDGSQQPGWSRAQETLGQRQHIQRRMGGYGISVKIKREAFEEQRFGQQNPSEEACKQNDARTHATRKCQEFKSPRARRARVCAHEKQVRPVHPYNRIGAR